MIFNHGSSREYDEHVDLAPLFTSRGYAFFFPFRRGHGRSEGPYVGDILDRARTRSDADWSRALVDQMGAQVEDQLSAIAYLSSLALVDPQRIVAIGSSFGGIQSTLIAESASIRGSVSFAGAAMTWARSPDLRARLLQSVSNARVPLLFIQAENDFDLTPSAALAEALARAGKAGRRIVYPAVGKTPMDGHRILYSSPEVWATDVFDFFDSVTGPRA